MNDTHGPVALFDFDLFTSVLACLHLHVAWPGGKR